MLAFFTGILGSEATISIQKTKNSAYEYDTQVIVLDPAVKPTDRLDAPPLMILNGVGNCIDGVHRAKFGGAVGRHSRFKVLGASMVSLIKPQEPNSVFGYWEIDLLRVDTPSDEGGKSDKYMGFWKEIEAIGVHTQAH